MPTFKSSSNKDDYSQSIHSDENQGKGTSEHHEIEQQDPSEMIAEAIPRLTDEEQEVINQRRNSSEFQQELLAMLPSDNSSTELSAEMEAILKAWAKEIEPVLEKSSQGLPLKLKAGIEKRTGIDMSDVIVHYNSNVPTEKGLLAYTKGNHIYLASGQEKHLPHEAWHVVQQKQGRVNPTLFLQKEKFNINSDLENEADTMAPKIDKESKLPTSNLKKVRPPQEETIQPKLTEGALNVVGEQHSISQEDRKAEQKFMTKILGINKKQIWLESEFKLGVPPKGRKKDKRPLADPFELRFLQSLNYAKKITRDNYSFSNRMPNFVETMQQQIQLLKKGKDGLELDGERKAYYYTLLETIKNWSSIDLEECRTQLDGYYEELKTHIANERSILPSSLDEELGIGYERSVDMHKAVQIGADAGMKGVWKVGDQHVQDMQNMDGINYELTDVNEFTAAYLNNTLEPTDEQIEDAKQKIEKRMKKRR